MVEELSLGEHREDCRKGKCERVEQGGGCFAWHPSLLCLLLSLPEDFSFSPWSQRLATQFTPLLIFLHT